MVKNRYKSLLSIESRKHPNKKENELENYLIKRLERENTQIDFRKAKSDDNRIKKEHNQERKTKSVQFEYINR